MTINRRISPAKMVLGLIFMPLIVYNILLIDVPKFILLKTENPKYSRYMVQDKRLNKTYHKNGIAFTPLNKISPHLIKAVLVAEDDLFFSHNGFNFKEIYKSFQLNLKRKRLARGASTISQQLARNLFLSKDKTLWRKLRELLITVRLEQVLSKERILELYLNTAEFAPGVYGVVAACTYHFPNTKLLQLTPSQAAFLAAILPNPKVYSKSHSHYTRRRQAKILRRMENYDLEIPKNVPVAAPGVPKQDNGKKTFAAKITLKMKEDVVDDNEEFDQRLDPEEVFLDE